MTMRRPNLGSSRPQFGSPALPTPDASALAARLPPGISVSSLSPDKPSREPMVVNDISSSDNEVIDDDDSDIVLDDVVIKKVPESSSGQLLSSMVAHSLPLLPSNHGDVSMLTHRVGVPKEWETTVLDWDLEDYSSPSNQDIRIGQVDGMDDLDSGEDESEPPKDNEMAEVSGDLEGEEVPGGGEEDELDGGAQPEEGEAQPDVEGHHHQEEIPEESLVGDGAEDEEPMVQNHQPDGLAELVSNLGVDMDGIDVGVDEEGLDLEGEEEQDFDYENQQNQEEDLVGEEYLDQDYMEGDQVGEVFEEGEGHQAYYDEDQEEEDDEAYNDEEDGDFYQAYAQPQAKKPKLQEQEEEVILESSDEEEESSVSAAAPKIQQWPHQRLPQQQQAQFGLQQPLHQQQQARAPAQFGLQQLQQQAMYAELLHGRGSSGQQQFGSQHQFHHQFAPLQRKRRRRTPTALCIKDGRVFLRPFTDLPPHISAKSLPPPEQSPYQPSTAMAASLMPSAISGHHLSSALSLGNPMGALGQLGHPSMGQQLGQQLQAAAYPSLLPQFHQYPQHQMASGQLAVQPGAPLRPQQHPLLQRAAMAARVGGSGSPTSLGSDSEDRSDSEVEEAEEEELGAMFPQRSKLPPMTPLKQQPLKEASHGEEVLEEDDDDDEIEALDNEGVGDEVEDGDEVMPDESNDDESVAVNAESTREEVLTFEESSKDVQEAEEEIPEAAAEEMLEAEEEEEEKQDNKEEEKEGVGEVGDEGGAEELQ